jgi:enamine deaminase RidA (YjgF/YER057c/UK114 family)
LQRLRNLGYDLPQAPPAMASYVPTRLVPVGEGRALVFIAGQVPRREGELMTGRVPDEVGLEQAQEAARVCALNVLAQIDSAVGLEQVEQIAQLTGYVQCAAGFGEQPEVINAASDLIVEVLGEAGRHSRAAIGVNALPRSVTVEIAAVVVVRT